MSDLKRAATVDLSSYGRIILIENDKIFFENPQVPEGRTIVTLPARSIAQLDRLFRLPRITL